MIYQPRNVQPSGTSIDVTKANTFTMEVQTNTYVNGYQLTIVDFNNTTVHTGTKQTLSTYVYNGDKLSIPIPANLSGLSNGTNYKWRVKLYQATADMLITYGLVQSTSTTTNIYLQPNINIRANMQLRIGNVTRTISSYNVTTGLAVVSSAFTSAPAVGTQYYVYSDFIETVPDYIFYARALPTVAISNAPTLVTNKYFTFQGTYTQSNSVPIVYHQFDLYIYGNDGNKTLLDSSGRVYSANLKYTYDSFKTGNSYSIQMTVENDMGIITSTDEYLFTVTYDIVEYLQQPSAAFDSKKNANQVTWVTPVENDATLIKNASISGVVQDGDNSLTHVSLQKGQGIAKGDIAQITSVVKGKNMLSFIGTDSRTISGVTITNNNDGSFTCNGTSTAEVSFRLSATMNNLQSGTYILSRNSSGSLSGQLSNIIYGNNGTAVSLGNMTNETRIITPNINYDTYYLWFYVSAGVSFDNYVLKIQMEAGDVTTTYEPYRPVGTKYTGVIDTYNSITGQATTQAGLGFTYSPRPTDLYTILGNIDSGEAGAQYLYQTPYSGVNSLYTHGYTAEWYSSDGLCVLPDDFNITMQFSPDGAFYFGDSGVYDNLQTVMNGKTDGANDLGSFKIYLNLSYLGLMTPHFISGSLDTNSIATPPSGQSNTTTQIYVTNNIASGIKYITFSNRNYIAEVVSFNSTTKLATLKMGLPFAPVVGEPFFTNDHIETKLYNHTSEVFVLSANSVQQLNNDYIWVDTDTWNDSYFWVEGGTSIQRVCDHWWKAQFTKTSIKVEEVTAS